MSGPGLIAHYQAATDAIDSEARDQRDHELKPLTVARLNAALKRLRAAGAREYATREEVRRHYRDGFTDGWIAREEVSR